MVFILSILLWMTYLASLYFTIYWLLVFIDKFDAIKSENSRIVKLDKYPNVTIIIPAYNEQDTIYNTARSVLDLDYPKEFIEIIIVDDGSIDNTSKVIEDIASENNGRDIKIISHGKNVGKAISLNDAIQIAKGEFFACLDADSFVHKDTLKKMLSLYYEKNDNNIAIVTPAMKIIEPRTWIQKFQRIEYLLFLFVARLMGYLDCISVAPGPFSVYKTEIIKKLGGFEVGNPTEDMEIAYRAQFMHYKIVHCFDADVYTIPPRTLKELYYQRRRRWFRGGIVNTMKYRKIILNKEYGDFGMIQVLINLSGYALSFSVLGFFVYYLTKPLWNNIHDLYLINFDLWPYIKTFNFNFSILDFDISKLFISLTLLFLSMFILYVAHRNAREKVTKYGVAHIIPYFLFYYLILSFIAVIAVFDYAIGKKWKW